ncbi:nuclear transport factor 2 family protein [Thalassotalea euphylliae]|uniref:Nuclear transport factor 2 family protein n=1 Tax=Thalassotalea euphylliae TaxID=1655234 RepID=A0A3E0U7A4_9GAMM|nr:nuclear transport factor 2 family protein [Thalassotalea euphylliae]REL32670.1 hypothetical protein DXX94_09120 [Thalassotalea euphylliae]
MARQFTWLAGTLLALALLSAYAIAYPTTSADRSNERAVKRAVLDYIESQIQHKPELMARGLDKSLAKRTYWQGKNNQEKIMETSHDFMVELASWYNQQGDKFSANPRVEIEIFDIDQRVSSVKLTVDDWIDYMHLYQNEHGQWKVLNVLWQYHDTSKHKS